ncbi:hypothetical protein [Methylocystis sp.]|jgi:hypothetical protein|uniref:hypothetical protein n=1 Tax=Methylocystis sp. TaxID=1911079 RepID=UPI0011D4EFDF|nr:hypothetical protein [Methylocystis sp.]KAF0133510.1 MAG: hypothetical protein FD148_1077 [Methylocystaceae bacterium]KAF0210206.1 MAG: hypothetical protein FD172_2823 [Methylocystaceae bacterium]MDP3555353.1 hypothetical protein [Methylocystis sp.]TXT48402.1 MAG: hypothetical protein FD139_12 [Methylocystaceae bacterium]
MNQIRRDWVSKTSAGAILGFSLAIGLAGLFAWLTPGGLATANKFQLVMWLIAPIWLTTLSLCFFFSSGMRAWLWLGGANLMAYAGLFACRLFLR